MIRGKYSFLTYTKMLGCWKNTINPPSDSFHFTKMVWKFFSSNFSLCGQIPRTALPGRLASQAAGFVSSNRVLARKCGRRWPKKERMCNRTAIFVQAPHRNEIAFHNQTVWTGFVQFDLTSKQRPRYCAA